MKRELEEEKRKERKDIAKHTYSYQLLGSNVDKLQEEKILLWSTF